MIKQDNWIRAQCETPSHIYRKQLGTIEYASHPFTKEQEYWSKIQTEFPTSLDVSPDVEDFFKCVSPDAEDFFKCPSVTPITPEELSNWRPMIHPFTSKNLRCDESGNRIISKGLSSFGYDVTLGNKFKIFTNINGGVIDPLNMPNNCYADFEGDSCIIPPNSYLLGYTVEYFHIPDDVVVVCVGKSTLARAGLLINVTPIEPGFQGQVVIEISNLTNLPVKVYANQGVAQFLFYQGSERCTTSYADKKGKYQNQTGITTAKV